MGVRMRFTILYGAMFLVSGLGLLAIVAAFGNRSSTRAAVAGAAPSPDSQVAILQRQLAEADDVRSRQLLYGTITALAVAVLLSVLLGSWIAGRVLRPLRVITAATRRITADSLHERLAVRGPQDEVKALADTIDDLLSRLEESFDAQRRFVSEASHELRTPLATMRASLDVAMAKPGPQPAEMTVLADRLRAELDHVDRLIEGFLLLARAQFGAFVDRETVSLTALAAEALRAQDTTGVTVSEELIDDVAVRGNPVLLARMVGNLVDNAVRHNVPAGWVRVRSVADDGWAVLTVESSGPVLDADQVRRLGRPFERLGAERTGAGTGLGLGMSIAFAVADAHGGGIVVVRRPEGGLRLVVELPLAAPVPVPA